MDIDQDILNETPLGPSQTALLEHISTLISFGESVTRQRIQIFTPLLKSYYEDIHKDGINMLCIMRNDTEIVTRRTKSSYLWRNMFDKGCPQCGTAEASREHVFPIVDNGGRIIGGISFTLSTSVQPDQFEREYILSDTMHRLMLTATDEQIQFYEPISYLDGLIIFDHTNTIIYGNEAALQLVDILGFNRRLIGSSIYGGGLKNLRYTAGIREQDCIHQ